MNGSVDELGRALIGLKLRASESHSATELQVWIDTAFTGELVVARSVIEGLKLPQSGAIRARLADDAEVVLSTYACQIEWLGRQRTVEVIENEGEFPLLGLGLLRECALSIDYRAGTVVIQ